MSFWKLLGVKESPKASIAERESTPASSNSEIQNAARNGDFRKLKALLKKNPYLVFSKDDQGETPLHKAAAAAHQDVAKLLVANRAEVNAKDNDGLTPLHMAARGGHKDVVELLLANKAEVNAKDSINGLTPLHYAAICNEKDMTELLLANKADVNAKDNHGITALRRAVAMDIRDMAELLCRHGGHQ